MPFTPPTLVTNAARFSQAEERFNYTPSRTPDPDKSKEAALKA